MIISDFDDGAVAITSVGGRLFSIYTFIDHIWPMLQTAGELAASLGQQIKQRRLGIGLTQTDAAARAGVSYRTWRRLEAEGKASIDDLVRAAVALRCEQDLASLFPEPPATSWTRCSSNRRRRVQRYRSDGCARHRQKSHREARTRHTAPGRTRARRDAGRRAGRSPSYGRWRAQLEWSADVVEGQRRIDPLLYPAAPGSTLPAVVRSTGCTASLRTA